MPDGEAYGEREELEKKLKQLGGDPDRFMEWIAETSFMDGRTAATDVRNAREAIEEAEEKGILRRVERD